MEAELFDKIAEAELQGLERVLGNFNPDEFEVYFEQGVLTLEFPDGDKIVVNSHRAAGEIWMAAFRQAWHFGPKEEDNGKWVWRTSSAELHATLAEVLTKKVGRPIAV